MTQVEETKQVLTSVDPATGEAVAEFPVMSSKEVDEVVERAREVSKWWASRSWAERERYLLRWASWLVEHADELIDLLVVEQGKARETAFLLELVPTLEQIRWAARNARKVLGRRTVWPGALLSNHSATIQYNPYGVVGVIGPWNYPVFTPAGQMAAYALAAGNTVVLKPSEYTPRIGKFLVDSFELANPDVPLGVLSLVTGYGQTGAALCRSGVDKIGFTGSTPTGKRILAACAENLVPAVLECGGKDAMIVAEDADVPAAAKAAAWGGMVNAGQTCVGIEQVYVVDGVKDRFLDELRTQLHDIRAGQDPDAPYGPMTTGPQVETVRRHIDDALDRGATAVVGGRDSVRAPYVDPVVLVDPADDSLAVTEETFGPVLVVRAVSDVEEAITLVNSRRFGLGASVFSRRRGREIADRVRSGMVGINCALSFVGIPSLPFGGVGESGFGRVHGADGLREFAVPKSFAQQHFAVPGMDTVTLRPSRFTIDAIRRVMQIRHGRRLL
ncbi:aldehyde dehydrogenase family protein [Nocardia sp. NPDC055029]